MKQLTKLHLDNNEKYIHYISLLDKSAQKYDFLGYDLVDLQRSKIFIFIKLKFHKKISPLALKIMKAGFFLSPTLSRKIFHILPALDSQTIAMRISFLVKKGQLLGENKEDHRFIKSEITNLLNRKNNEIHGIGWGSIFNITMKNTKENNNFITSGTSAMHSVAWITKALHDTHDAGMFPDFPQLSQQIVEHICKDYYFTQHNSQSLAVSYTTDDRSSVINVSAEASALLYRASELNDNNVDILLAEHLLCFVLETQKDDGRWGYTAFDNNPDVHHTSMILMALSEILKSPRLNKNFEIKIKYSFKKGAVFFLDNFFHNNGQPIPYFGENNYWNAYAFPYAIRGLVTIVNSSLLSKKEQEKAVTILLKSVDKTIELIDFKNDSIIIEYRMKKKCRLRSWRCGTTHMSLALTEFLDSKKKTIIKNERKVK